MSRLWLLDNSAWARTLLPGLPPETAVEFATDLRARAFGVCLPFRLEAGYSARNGEQFRQLMGALDQLPSFGLGQVARERASDCQAQLVSAGHHRIPPVDLMIAAIADVEGVGVIHYDADYDRILEHSDLRFESRWLAPRGSI